MRGRHAETGGAGPARPPAVAGRFYPADPAELAADVDRHLDAVAVPAGEPPALGYVVPHAGYRYSGGVAAAAYARLRRRTEPVDRVVLIGPAHYARIAGCVVPAADRWRTPLGELAIDVDRAAALVRDGHVTVDDRPHASEHALEVQLPFLQRALGRPVPVLPIAVGPSSVDDLVITLAAATGPGTVVLCSTDLSHYLDQAGALRQDARTIAAIEALAPERIGVRDACGVFALRGLVGWARHDRLVIRLLRASTSAETGGDPARVVGYAAFALDQPGAAQS